MRVRRELGVCFLGVLVCGSIAAVVAACGLSVTGASSGSTPDAGPGASLPPSGSSSDGTTSSSSSGTSGTSGGGTSSGVINPDRDGGGADGGDGGCVDQVLSFDGMNDDSTVPSDAELDLTGSFTVEAWVKPAITTVSGVQEMQIVSHHNHDNNDGWVLLFKDGRAELRVYGSNGQQTAGNDGPPYVVANKWMFVAGTWDGDRIRIYTDGVLRDNESTIQTRRHATGPVHIGRALYQNNFHFNGLIDEVRISRVARYVQNTMTVPTAKFAADVDTVALYHFDEVFTVANNNFFNAASTTKHIGTLAATPMTPTAVLAECINARLP
jgi:hypothetical protein